MEFVQFDTADGLRLNGVITGRDLPIIVIHLHGKGGNFYENQFVKVMFDRYPSQGIGFLSFNNRGYSSYTESYRHGQVDYIGTAVERFEESLHDVAAAVAFVRSLGAEPVVQGHSFGCEKAMYYGQQVDATVPLVLLSPSDGWRLQEEWIKPETIEQQLARLRAEYALAGMEWLPDREYGIRTASGQYHVPITAAALVGLMTGPAFGLLRLAAPVYGDVVQNPTFVYLGGQDGLQVDGIDAIVAGLGERFAAARAAVYPDGNHHLKPLAATVVDDIAAWARSVR